MKCSRSAKKIHAGARAVALAAYLQALVDQIFCAKGEASRWTHDERHACALLLKVWFSPDGLFRPVRGQGLSGGSGLGAPSRPQEDGEEKTVTGCEEENQNGLPAPGRLALGAT